MVTVHGLRDDHQTAWTSSIDSSHWIQSKLFSYASIRHLDYVYDTGDSARVYGPNGINMEANALLASLAQERTQLLDVCISYHTSVAFVHMTRLKCADRT